MLTETVLLSLGSERSDVRLALRRAFLTGTPVQTDLVRSNGPVRIVDYTEFFHDGHYEIAISVAPARGSAQA